MHIMEATRPHTVPNTTPPQPANDGCCGKVIECVLKILHFIGHLFTCWCFAENISNHSQPTTALPPQTHLRFTDDQVACRALIQCILEKGVQLGVAINSGGMPAAVRGRETAFRAFCDSLNVMVNNKIYGFRLPIQRTWETGNLWNSVFAQSFMTDEPLRQARQFGNQVFYSVGTPATYTANITIRGDQVVAAGS